MRRYAMFLRISVRALLRGGSRPFGALLALALGATVLLGMGAVYYDIPRQMGREFRSYGANLILAPAGGSAVLRLEEAQAALQLLPADKLIGAAPLRHATLYYHQQGFNAAGADFDAARLTNPWWRIDGAWPEREREVLLGLELAERCGLNPGDSLRLETPLPQGRRLSKDFTVSGILRSGGPEETFVFLALPDLEAMLGGAGTVDALELSIAAGGEELAAFAQQIGEKFPGLAPRLVKRIAASEETVLKRLRLLSFMVTAVVLILTLICVAAAMFAAVTRRRGEIGLKKALGAENRTVIAEILGEYLTLALAGGCLGAGAGWVFAQAVGLSVFARGVTPPLFLLPVTLAASLGIAALASIIPALMAARVQPALALRGE